MLVVAMLEHRALPCDFPGGRGGSEKLGHNRRAICRDQCVMGFRLVLRMPIAFRQAMVLNALDCSVQSQEGAPIFPERIGFPPVVIARLPEALVFAGVGQAFLIAGHWRGKSANLRALSFGKLGADSGELNDLCGFDVAHDCTAFPAGTLINTSIAAA